MEEENLIPLEEALGQGAIAKAASKDVFQNQFSGLIMRLEAQEKNLQRQENFSIQVIIGVLLAATLVFITSAWGIYIFITGYNERILDAEKTFLERTAQLERSNIEWRSQALKDVEQLRKEPVTNETRQDVATPKEPN